MGYMNEVYKIMEVTDKVIAVLLLFTKFNWAKTLAFYKTNIKLV